MTTLVPPYPILKLLRPLLQELPTSQKDLADAIFQYKRSFIKKGWTYE
ncbi:MAG: hypothetical protein HEQ32_08340 [Vampirovibrio sp.]